MPKHLLRIACIVTISSILGFLANMSNAKTVVAEQNIVKEAEVDQLKSELAKKVKGLSYIKTYGNISEYRLDNGLKILLKQDLNAPLISWQLWYKVGSRNEKFGQTGLAHYLEHMMFKGTDIFDKGEIAQIIQLQGGIFNAFTGDDYTAYFENFSPENLELAIKIESNRMRKAQLKQEEIDLERSVIISELEGGENNPTSTLYKNLKASAYNVHSYKNPIIGWDTDLQNINAKNMRKFYDKYYSPDNAVAVLVGNFNEALALRLIGQYFADYEASPRYQADSKANANNCHRHPVTPEPKQAGERRTVIHKEGLVKMLAMSFHIPEFDHEDSAALQVISDIVFDGTGSRVYKKLVDSGVAISVSGHAEASIDPGLFRIIANVNLDEDINKVEQMIAAELEAIKSGASKEELERSRARVEASAVYERDGIYNEGMQIGYFEAISSWENYVDWVDRVLKITNDDIKRVAKKYFIKSNKTVVHLLPEKGEESLLETVAEAQEFNGKMVQGYGSAVVEPLDPEKLEKLLKLAKPQYTAKFSKEMGIDTQAEQLDLKLKTFELDIDNPGANIKVILKEDHNLPLVYITGNLFAGAIADRDQGKPTLAYLTAEMLERGTKKHDKFEVIRLLDLYGADISFSNKKEVVEFELSSIKKNLPTVLALFREHLHEPRFDPKELEKLKKETIAQVKQEDESLHNITARELNRLIYPKDHPYYSYLPAEKIKAIESISLEDIKEFYRRNYNPRNLIISIAGDITKDEAKDSLYDLFFSWNVYFEKGESPETQANIWGKLGNKKPKIDRVKANKPTTKTITVKEKRQVEVALGHSTDLDRNHPDFYAMLIANFALGGSPLSSKLGTVVRDENGLAYDVRSGFKSTLGAGSFIVGLGTNPKNVTKAIELAKQVVKDFLRDGITETELEATKSYITGSFAARNLSSNEEISKTLGSIILYDLGYNYIESHADIINGISLEEVNEAARRHIFPDKLHTVIAGPEYD